MNILHLFSISIIISGSLYPVFALDTPQVCDANSLPHYGPHNPSHIYIKDTNGSIPYIPLTYHTAVLHDDDVWNTSTQPRIVQVTLTIQNQDTGQQVFNQTQSLQMQACSGPESVKWRFVPTQIANYIATVSDNRDKENMIFNSMLDATKSKTVSSPLEQLRFGIDLHSIVCKQDLQLVIKSEYNSPACVKLDTAYMLIKRGWAVSESAYPGGDSQFALDTNSTIIPAHLPRSSGLRIPYYEPSRVINYSGFDGVYNETFPFRGTQNDYVLKPGSTGVITFKLEAVSTEQQGQSYPISLPKSLNLTNYAIFYHEITSLEDLSKYPGVTFSDNDHRGGFTACSKGPAGGGSCIGGPSDGANSVEAFVTDHPGIDILFEPPSEVLPLGINATSQVVTMTITADSNAPRGTYLVILPSIGVNSFLLTVGDKPYHE